MNIIYEDDAVIVVEKPAGVESQESKGLAKDMVSEIKKHLKKNNSKDLYVGVVHRLDKPVRGIMVYAKTKQAAAELSRQMAKAGHMDKVYLAVCEGVPKNAKLTLKDYLAFDRKTNSSRVVKETDNEAKLAELELELVDAFKLTEREHIKSLSYFEKQLKTIENCETKTELRAQKNDNVQGELSEGMETRQSILTGGAETKLSLVRVKLMTGRHHQIRVQLANAGLPIVGDTKYNSSFAEYRGLPALCLCSVEIGFVHPVTRKNMIFTLDGK